MCEEIYSMWITILWDADSHSSKFITDGSLVGSKQKPGPKIKDGLNTS